MVALSLAAGLITVGSAAPVAAADRVELRGSVPAYADPTEETGRVPAGERLNFQVVLGLRDRRGARALAKRVSDPRSDSYREFVSAAEFRRRYSWRRSEIVPVKRWLRRRGLSVGAPTPNGVLLPAAGTAADFERAFGTRPRAYRAAGQELVAPSGPLSVPRRISHVVRGTIGVPEAPLRPHLFGAGGAVGDTPRARAAPSADPGPPLLGSLGGVVSEQPRPFCSRYWGQTIDEGLPNAYGQHPLLSICGYKARQIRSAYGAKRLHRRGIDGSGVDIGIVTGYLSPTLQSDLNAYSDENGIPRTRLRIRTPSRGYRPQSADYVWDFYTEQTLDVQVSHGVASGARIHYSGPDAGPNDSSALIVADSEMVDRNRVDVISNSWGLPEFLTTRAFFRAGEDVFTQAAAQGITMLYSSGDTGDNIAEDGIRTVQYPASSRRVTAVGGTTLSVGPTGARVWEQGWGESAADLNGSGTAWDPQPPGNYIAGSTGGTSRAFPQPRYQRARVPKRLAGYFGGRARVVPDVGLIADIMSGPGLVQTAVDSSGQRHVTRHSVGGTSVASPVLAGLVAVMADRNGGRLGFLNPSLYRVRGRAVRRVGPARNPAVSAAAAFNNFLNAEDGISYQLLSGGQYGTLRVRKGYDDVTGLGSPSARKLAKRLRRMSR